MADKKKLTNSFSSNRRRKKPSLEEIEQIAEQVVPPKPAPKPKAKPAARPQAKAKTPAPKPPVKAPKSAKSAVVLKKTSVDLPLDLYQDLKIHLIKRQLKFREYLIELIEADLGR